MVTNLINHCYVLMGQCSGSASFSVGTPKYLFSLSDENLSGLVDVSANGQVFLGVRPMGKAAIPPLTYIQNWEGLVAGGEN